MIELSDLLRDERELEIDLEGIGTLNITYMPSAYTPRRQEIVMGEINEKRGLVAIAKRLAPPMLVDWNLCQDGEKIPVTEEALMELPGQVLNEIMNAIITDSELGGKETRKNSGAGSRHKAK